MIPVSVDIRNVALSYGATQVLRDISLEIRAGEFFALLGPSGSGKTTLLRLIAGFNQHQRGEVLIAGRDVSGTPPWKRDVGMVFQNYALWPHMTVDQNVAFGLEERKLQRNRIRERVAAALELVGLTGFGSRRPGQLSGGQQQRVALARTLAIEPQVLLLDEPLSNLDAKLRVQTRQELRRLQQRLGITTIFVTHDQEEALTTCDRIAVMDQGVIQQVGTPMDLFDHPVNRFVAGFVGSANIVKRAEGDVAFRPHAVSLRVAPAQPTPGELSLQGAVDAFEFLGEFVRYDVLVGDAHYIADVSHARDRAPLPKGTAVIIGVPASELRVLGQ
ncbi:MAG: ABC transporter ATP-binding protein [Terriglobales bacterium]